VRIVGYAQVLPVLHDLIVIDAKSAYEDILNKNYKTTSPMKQRKICLRLLI
jgi:hypothetical protein